MSLEEFLKKEGELLIEWPRFNINPDYLSKFPNLNPIEVAKYVIPVSTNGYSVNKILAKATGFATQFNRAIIAYRKDSGEYKYKTAASVFENEADIGISDALDDWLMNDYEKNVENEILILSNPLVKDSFVAHVVSDGEGCLNAQLLSDPKMLENCEFTIENLNDFDYVSKDDYKGKTVSEDKLGRLIRHYSRFKGEFDVIYGLTRPNVADGPGKSKVAAPGFFTTNYSSLAEKSKK